MPASQNPFDIQPQGPFNQYLDPANPAGAVQWSNGQQPSGWEGKTGNIAFLGTKLLEGITKGRVTAFAKKEQQKMQTFGHLTSMMEAIRANPSVSPEVKANIEKQYAVMLGKMGSSQIKDSGATKDKGVRGNIASTLGSVFDKMAGGPFKGDPLTVEDMSSFMGEASKAIQGSGSSASGAYQAQQEKITAGMKKAQQIAAQQGRRVVTLEDTQQVPEIQEALRWYGQYAPEQLKSVQGQFATLPSQSDPKAWAGTEYTARTLAPPETRQKQIAAPPNHEGQGYLGLQYGQGDTSAPPEARSVARLGDSSVARLPVRQGPPGAAPEHEEDQQVMENLREMAGIGPKAEVQVPIFNEKGEAIGFGPKSAADSFYRSRTVGQGQERIDAAADQRKTSNLFKEKNLAWRKEAKEKDQTLAQKRINVAAASVGVAGASEKLRETENDERRAPEHAWAQVINDANEAGIPISQVVDHIDEVMDGITDPKITAHKDYILKQASALKHQAQSGDISSLFAPAGAAKTSAPPATRSKPQAKSPAVDPKSPASRILKSKAFKGLLDDDDSSASGPADLSGKTPQELLDIAAGKK